MKRGLGAERRSYITHTRVKMESREGSRALPAEELRAGAASCLGLLPGSAPSVPARAALPRCLLAAPAAVPSAAAGPEGMGQPRTQPPQHGQGSSPAASLAKGAKPCFGGGSLAGRLQGEPERGQLSLGWLEGR